jgi:hypothetical protein
VKRFIVRTHVETRGQSTPLVWTDGRRRQFAKCRRVNVITYSHFQIPSARLISPWEYQGFFFWRNFAIFRQKKLGNVWKFLFF